MLMTGSGAALGRELTPAEHIPHQSICESWRSRSLISGTRAWLVSSPAKWPGNA